MASLNEALRASAAKAAEEHEKVVRERLISYHSDAFGHAASYDTVVIVAGYAAFFALWGGVSADISPLARSVTVALMGGSLICYLAWQIIQMLTRQTYEFKRADIFALADDPARFNAAWLELEQRAAIAQGRIIRIWPYTFVPAVVLGFASGGVLAYNALALALGWPDMR